MVRQIGAMSNGHFRNQAYVDVNRPDGGRTTLELVGCRGVGALQDRCKLIGKTGTTNVLMFVRDCDITGLSNMTSLDQAGSTNYHIDGLDNWKFPDGAVTDSSAP